MKLVIIRHADAGDRQTWAKSGRPDFDRPLTTKGQNQSKVLAKHFKFVLKKSPIILTSPLVRARETAEIVQKKSMPQAKMVEVDELKPLTDPKLTVKKIQSLFAQDFVVIVGHEPHLSRFLSFILTGGGDCPLDMSKGSIAMVEFDEGIQKGRGRLTCLLQPQQLKKLKNSVRKSAAKK